MKYRQLSVGLLAGAGMLLLILDSNTAFHAAEEGVRLCINTVIPSIFPFLTLSIYMNQSLMGIRLPFLKPVAKIMRLPVGAESILISAFLGGYPAGAQAVYQHYEAGSISKKTAEKLLAFTNNAGPSFIFGIISHMFTQKWVPWLIWSVHIISAIYVSQIIIISEDLTVPSAVKSGKATMERALNATASICGWVVLFKILSCLILKILPADCPDSIQVLLTGILELSNGCLSLDAISSFPLRFMVCSLILAFGGICVTMQTSSVIKGLNMRYYFIGKIIQAIISIIVCAIIIYGQWILFTPLFAALLFLRRNKNNCRNKELIRV